MVSPQIPHVVAHPDNIPLSDSILQRQISSQTSHTAAVLVPPSHSVPLNMVSQQTSHTATQQPHTTVSQCPSPPGMLQHISRPAVIQPTVIQPQVSHSPIPPQTPPGTAQHAIIQPRVQETLSPGLVTPMSPAGLVHRQDYAHARKNNCIYTLLSIISKFKSYKIVQEIVM